MDEIDSATTVGHVHLRIADLDRSIAFYTDHLGLVLRRRHEHTAWLGTDTSDLLVVSAGEFAARPRGTTGLYHFAILVPSRPDLARSLRRLVDTGTTMAGFADHGVSEALYLADPDGIGIEIYRDRPRSEWPRAGGELHMGTEPLDVDGLLGVADAGRGTESVASGTVVGHVHLHVSRIADAEHFYAGVLGFKVMQRYGQSALFVAAGDYHHHVGLNTWAGIGAPPPPPNAIGLAHVEIRLPDDAALGRVADRVSAAGIAIEGVDGGLMIRDPSENVIVLTV